MFTSQIETTRIELKHELFDDFMTIKAKDNTSVFATADEEENKNEMNYSNSFSGAPQMTGEFSKNTSFTGKIAGDSPKHSNHGTNAKKPENLEIKTVLYYAGHILASY